MQFFLLRIPICSISPLFSVGSSPNASKHTYIHVKYIQNLYKVDLIKFKFAPKPQKVESCYYKYMRCGLPLNKNNKNPP